MKPIGTLMLVLVLGACATPSQQPQMLWHRTDGRSMQSDPALLKQGEIDRTVCDGERLKVLTANPQNNVDDRQNAAFEVMKGCMAQRGYVWR
jgi:hypothetical protein